MQKEPLNVVVTAALPRELHEQLVQLAKANYHSTAAEIRRALAAHLKAADKQMEKQ
jgi:predicted transcriptional regulator